MNFLKTIKEQSLNYEQGYQLTNRKSETGNKEIDWDMVKKIIDSGEYDQVEVGLAEDWECTHAIIFKNSKLVKKENESARFYGASRWATPAIKLYKDGVSDLFECYNYGEHWNFPHWMDDVNYSNYYE